ncbi:uncharacterized protein LOC141530240 [Cotesia typhae]|uniref:uncharacterized protein LOC141530240 n=1 Tax=Cotesia typhae TaxID=2053667 RepID=UPI003D68A2FD
MTSRKLSECRNLGYDVICDIRKGKMDKARAVIEKHGLGYSELWSQGYVLLCEALKNQHEKLAEYVLTFNDVKINNKNEFQTDTPLHLAASNGYEGIVKTLLDRGADIKALNSRGRTPLDLAADCKHCSIVELILRQKNVDLSSLKWPNYPLLHRAAKSSVIIVQNLLDKGLEVDFVKDGLTPLHRAAFSSCLAVVKCLVEHKADVNAVSSAKSYLGFTVLHFAAIKPDAEVVKFLLENGSSINTANKKGATPLNLALRTADEEVVNVFLRRGVDINTVTQNGLTPLQYAIKHNKESMVHILLKHGADTKVLDKSGRSILNFALSYDVSSLIIWEDLVKYGANINELDEFTRESKESLLHLTINHRSPRMLDIIEFLIKHGANVDAADATGATPIFYAIKKNQFVRTVSKSAVLLLEAGANVNAKNQKGKTPLHLACELGNAHNVQMLLKYGADVNLRCFNDMLPIKNLTFTGPDTVKIVSLIYMRVISLYLAGLYFDKYFHFELTCSTCSVCQAKNTGPNIAAHVMKKECAELNNLKKKYIACNLTFYSLLTKSSHELAIYKRNPVINKIIQSTNILEEYPTYGGIILRNLVAASARMKMIEESKKRDIYRIFPGIPVEMTDYIFKFLNNDDFFTLIQAL